ncbi:MAG: hypothetical protein Q7S16_03765 [bacterium]|nr:hypothetical protein [bacterium]
MNEVNATAATPLLVSREELKTAAMSAECVQMRRTARGGSATEPAEAGESCRHSSRAHEMRPRFFHTHMSSRPRGENSESKEPSYDKKAWEELKHSGLPYDAIQRGKALGVPQEVLESFANDQIMEKTLAGEYDWIFRFRTSLGMGTPKELRGVKLLEHQCALQNKEYLHAAQVAEELFGKDSVQYHHAMDLFKQEQSEEEKMLGVINEEGAEECEHVLTLSKNATFMDLFRALNKTEKKEGFGEVHFEDEVLDHFGDGILEEIQRLYSERSQMRILDFFAEYGYSKEAIEAYLPIQFTS